MAPTSATTPKKPAWTPVERAPLPLGLVEVLDWEAGGLIWDSVLPELVAGVEVEGDEGIVTVEEPELVVPVDEEEVLPEPVVMVKSLD